MQHGWGVVGGGLRVVSVRAGVRERPSAGGRSASGPAQIWSPSVVSRRLRRFCSWSRRAPTGAVRRSAWARASVVAGEGPDFGRCGLGGGPASCCACHRRRRNPHRSRRRTRRWPGTGPGERSLRDLPPASGESSRAASNPFSFCSLMAFIISVMNGPGAITLTRTPRSAHSDAIVRVKLSNAAFAAV